MLITAQGRRENVIFYNDLQYNESEQNPDFWNMVWNLIFVLIAIGFSIPYILG